MSKERIKVHGPMRADHPALTEQMSCPRCEKPFVEGDYFVELPQAKGVARITQGVIYYHDHCLMELAEEE